MYTGTDVECLRTVGLHAATSLVPQRIQGNFNKTRRQGIEVQMDARR